MESNRIDSSSASSGHSDPLFELIESMSSTEKRYFNVQVKNIKNNDGSVPDYFIFFQILNKMEEYNEEQAKKKLLKKLGKKGFSNFTVKKNELYDVLLRTLKNYHFMRMKKSASYIKVLIQDANFLFKRGLYKQAKKNLKEARKMAEKCGDTLSLIEINRFEREFLRTNRETKRGAYLEKLHEEELKLIEHLKIEAELHKDYDYLSAILFEKSRLTDKESIEEVKNEFKHLTDLEENKDFPTIAKRYFRGSLSSYYRLIGENDDQIPPGQTLFDWWKENDLWRKQMPHYYIATLSNDLSKFNRKKEYHRFPEVLEMLEKLETNNQHESTVRFHRLMIFRQLYYMNTGLIDEACLLASRIEKGLKNYKLNEGVQISISYNSVIAFFVNHQFQDCLQWIEFFNRFKKVKRGKLQIQFLQVLRVIALYELGELELMEKAHRRAKNYLLKYMQLSNTEFEIVMLDLIKKYSEVIPGEQKKILNEMKTFINKMQSSYETRRNIGAEELILWITGKLENMTMKKLLIEQNKKRVSAYKNANS